MRNGWKRGFLYLWVLMMVVGLVVGPSPARAAMLDELDPAQLDAYLTTMMDEAEIPGLALGIVQGEEVVYLKGFGTADATGRAVTPDTSFLLGSISKSLTATAVMQLVDRGLVQLDAPVQTYLPQFAVADPEASRRITVRHLLQHVSGLPSPQGLAMFLQQPPELTSEEALADLRTVELAAAPGAQYHYSNANYVVLGKLLETVSGQRFGDYLEAHVLRPLGMTHSFTNLATAQANGLAQGYQSLLGWPQPVQNQLFRDAGLPCGYVAASASDMARFLLMHLNGGRGRDAEGRATQVLSPAANDLLHQPPVLTTGGLSDYAMGWGVSGSRWSHDGQVENYFSHMLVLKEHQVGVILMTNSYHVLLSEDIIHGIVSGIEDLLAGQTPSYQETGYWTWIVLYDLGLLLCLLLVVGAWLGLRTWRRRVAEVSAFRAVGVPLLQALVLGGLLAGVPIYTPFSWSIMLYSHPDLAGVVYATAVVFIGQGLCRFWMGVRHLQQPTTTS